MNIPLVLAEVPRNRLQDRERGDRGGLAAQHARSKPAGAKGNFVNRISLSSSQGVGVKIDAGSVVGAGTA